MGISKRYTNERKEKYPKKGRRSFMITEVHHEGRFPQTEYRPGRSL